MENFRQFRDTIYFANKEGIILNKNSGREVKGHIDKKGYRRIKIGKGGSTYGFHKVVAECWIDIPEDIKDDPTLQVDHIDGDKLNNSVSNLRWVTGKQNCNNPVTLSKLCKPIVAYDKNTMEEVKEYPSIYEADRDGYNRRIVFNALNQHSRHKTAYGYIWKYKKAI